MSGVTMTEQLEWPMSLEEVKLLPMEERERVAGVMFWLRMHSPVPSAPDLRWRRYRQALQLLDVPDWAVERLCRPHDKWKDRRKARRKARRLERKLEREAANDAEG